jgi:ABC-type sugar transport system permease subunit
MNQAREENQANISEARRVNQTDSCLWRLQHHFAPYFFVSPFILIFSIFIIYPLVRSLYLSFCNTVGPNDVRLTGLTNYRFLLHDPVFWLALGNTTLYVTAFVVIQISLALALAIVLNNPLIYCRSFFRFAFFSTNLVGQVFVAVVFTQLLNPRHGLLTQIIHQFNHRILEVSWLTDPVLCRVAVVMAWLWLSVGYGMIYFLAALQAVDQQLYEAATVDGAGKWSQFWHVTIPGIRPVLIFLILFDLVGGFQLFELPFVLLQGPGPGWAGFTIVMDLFMTGFGAGNLGYASTIGWVLAVIIFIVATLQLWISKRVEEG